MTREEVIRWFEIEKSIIREVSEQPQGARELTEAYDMAINALAVYPQFKWERDMAIEQLDEYGIPFGAKKDDDVVKVVRCKDCKYWQEQEEGIVECSVCTRIHDMVFEMGADGFCSKGERKGGEGE